MIQINESEWRKIKAEHEARAKAITNLMELHEDLARRHHSLINNILSGAPECWDGDQSEESLCEEYVRSLDANSTSMPGHRDDCSCWE
jgi:hypothetical protein